jgi:hypothetical protein
MAWGWGRLTGLGTVAGGLQVAVQTPRDGPETNVE